MIDILTGPVINFTHGSNGTYLLYMRIIKPIKVIIPNKEITIDEGYYIYVGSAFGPGGLSSRIHRHLRISKKNHWHIDQLTTSQHCSILSIAAFLDERSECQIAQKLTDFENISTIGDIGNSDCRNSCSTHFFKVEIDF